MEVMNLIPKSRAKTAYGLLSEIRALILAEPKRYNQRDTLVLREHSYMVAQEFPACGTIGCVAGWTVALKAQRPSRHIGGIMAFAQRKLGLTGFQADQLFDGSAAAGTVQTLSHAKSGAAHIARFQKANRAQLLAKKV